MHYSARMLQRSWSQQSWTSLLEARTSRRKTDRERQKNSRKRTLIIIVSTIFRPWCRRERRILPLYRHTACAVRSISHYMLLYRNIWTQIHFQFDKMIWTTAVNKWKMKKEVAVAAYVFFWSWQTFIIIIFFHLFVFFSHFIFANFNCYFLSLFFVSFVVIVQLFCCNACCCQNQRIEAVGFANKMKKKRKLHI